MTLDEISDYIGALHSETRSHTPFLQALTADREAEECQRIGGLSGVATIKERERDVWLLKLTIRALRNQGQPYYRV